MRLTLVLFLLAMPSAFAEICDPSQEACWGYRGRSSSTPSSPSSGSSIKINPSAVPVAKGFGLETLYYSSSFDFSIVQGTGRVGAAISPSNGEETFFGPPGFEIDPDYLKRMQDGEKYESQKYTLAAGATLFNNKRNGLKRMSLSLGLLAKYHKITHDLMGGAGLSGSAGPLSLGYAVSQDEFLIDYSTLGLDETKTLRYTWDTLSAGLSFSYFAFDYSYMRVYVKDMDTFHISLLSAGFFFKRWILSAASRREESPRSAYDFKTRTLKVEKVKRETFGGIQFSATKHLMFGIFHNYYLQREISLGLTLFF